MVLSSEKRNAVESIEIYAIAYYTINFGHRKSARFVPSNHVIDAMTYIEQLLDFHIPLELYFLLWAVEYRILP